MKAYRQQIPQAQKLLLNVSLYNREDHRRLADGFWDYTIDLTAREWFDPVFASADALLLHDAAWNLAEEGHHLNLQGVVCLIGIQNAILFTPKTVGTYDVFENGQFEHERSMANNPQMLPRSQLNMPVRHLRVVQ